MFIRLCPSLLQTSEGWYVKAAGVGGDDRMYLLSRFEGQRVVSRLAYKEEVLKELLLPL